MTEFNKEESTRVMFEAKKAEYVAFKSGSPITKYYVSTKDMILIYVENSDMLSHNREKLIGKTGSIKIIYDSSRV
jgi:hypothetical protein